MLSGKAAIWTFVSLVLVIGAMALIIMSVTNSLKTMCSGGAHYDETAKKCIPDCTGDMINQPTLGYECSQCPKGYQMDSGRCVKSCKDNADCPVSPTGAPVNCLEGLCSGKVWTCNQDDNGHGGVCTAVTGSVPIGVPVYSSRKECINFGGCKCERNWEWNASMDACNTYSCTKNAQNGWGSRVSKDKESIPSQLFRPFQSADGICLPVTEDGTPGLPDATKCQAKTREACFSTGSKPNDLSCRWFPNTVCNRLAPDHPWDACTCGGWWCIGNCNTNKRNNGYTKTKCHNVGGKSYCRSNLRVNDKVTSNCGRKYTKAGGEGIPKGCALDPNPPRCSRGYSMKKKDDYYWCEKDGVECAINDGSIHALLKRIPVFCTPGTEIPHMDYNPLEYQYCQLNQGNSGASSDLSVTSDMKWVTQPVTKAGVGDYVATNGVDKKLENGQGWCSNSNTRLPGICEAVSPENCTKVTGCKYVPNPDGKSLGTCVAK